MAGYILDYEGKMYAFGGASLKTLKNGGLIFDLSYPSGTSFLATSIRVQQRSGSLLNNNIWVGATNST